MTRDEDLCPHCGSKVHREYEQHQQIMPAECESGCHEFYGIEGNASADDEEILAGWWKHEGLTDSTIGLFRKPRDEVHIRRMRTLGVQALQKREEEEAVHSARLEAKMQERRVKEQRAQQYLDEALF